MPNKMKSNNPPRRVEIRGQDHLLAYITPDEAQLLMDNGGSGEPGPMGIPAFPPGGRAGGDVGGAGRGGGGGSAGRDGGSDRDGPRGGRGGGRASAGKDTSRSEDRDAAQADRDRAADRAREAERQAAGEAARQRIAEANAKLARETAAKRAAEQVAQSQDLARSEAIRADQREMARAFASRPVAGLTREQYGAMPGYMKAVYDQTGAYNYDIDPATGKVLGFTGPSLLGFTPGIAGLLTSLMPEPTTEADLGGVYTGFGRMGDGMGRNGGRDDDVVPTQTNPVTGQEECPEGYVFDADIQACRVAAPLANVGGTVGGTGFDYEPGTYARMGLLDVAPEDLGGFASTYDIGFGTPQDFEAANLAYRRRAGTQAGIFQDPYNLQGYTLLA